LATWSLGSIEQGASRAAMQLRHAFRNEPLAAAQLERGSGHFHSNPLTIAAIPRKQIGPIAYKRS
jgi:hypothetical protein